MKRIICALTVITVFASCVFCFIPANAEENGTIEINYTDSTPDLDGTAEQIWKSADYIDISKNTSGDDAPTGKMKLLWNEGFLFVYCEITDGKVCTTESLDENNDCLRFRLCENPFNMPEDGEFRSRDGNLDFLIYSEYKEEKLGKTINNNLRDYVAAEYKITDYGYNVEAIVKLSRTPIIGDKLLIGADIYSISEKGGNVTSSSALSEGLTEVTLVDRDELLLVDDKEIKAVTADLSYGYTAEELREMKELYTPDVFAILSKNLISDNEITAAFEGYDRITAEGSEILIMYNKKRVKPDESGLIDSKSKADCLYAFFKITDSSDSFYFFASLLDRNFSAVRRAQASDIRSSINVMNKYNYPIILCSNIFCGENSFTYDIFALNGFMDAVKKTTDTVVRSDDNTLYTFISTESLDVKICRMIAPGDGLQSDECGAMAVSAVISAKTDPGIAKQRKIFTVIEIVLTAAVAGAVAVILYRKSKGKERKKKC